MLLAFLVTFKPYIYSYMDTVWKVVLEEVEHYFKKTILSIGAAIGVAVTFVVCVFIIAPMVSCYFRSLEVPPEEARTTQSLGERFWFPLFVGLEYAFS